MSTAMDFIMDTGAVEQKGPFATVGVTNDVLPSGPFDQIPDVARRRTEPGAAPVGSGGLTYIDQSVGGVQDTRGDVVHDYGGGFRSYSSRTSPFNGDTLVARVPFRTDTSGYVGFQRGGTAADRASMGNPTRIPDQSSVIAAATNPGLARLLRSLRGGE